jgi:dipeptidase
MGCDSLVALAPTTRDGVTVFAKNSDRPPRECQRVVQVPRAFHASGAVVRCQYVELPQVGETAAVLGSQPWWLWGFEHGVNEHGVAIGNETVFAREPLGAVGLTGMDLVRLGLERGRTATAALDEMVRLLETHGQGGSGHVHLDWPYHNAFLIADPNSAWVLETSGRHWVARSVRDVANISNGLAIGAEWERGAADVTSFAVAQGWWAPDAGPVDFAAAYADASGVPPNLCDGRRRRGAALLDAGRGRHTPAGLCAILRDHHADGPVRRTRAFDDPDYFTLCMHADPLDNTTAAMVAALPRDRGAVEPAWMCLGSPCVGAFVPLYLGAEVPAVLGIGSGEPDPASPWWRARALLTLVERDFARWVPVVRRRWDPFEAELRDEAATMAGASAEALAAFMRRAVDRHAGILDELLSALA